ncbi:hypothetical protein TIFTF001_029833 [Ficus carica]|uniref:Uncharacterized protein n=1 Tax=Ficus carica TaxID=3494 RepID=A0AA88DS85_FICCA|nr:hypothetical protein TIFTF001_029833 [Ficus carica]
MDLLTLGDEEVDFLIGNFPLETTSQETLPPEILAPEAVVSNVAAFLEADDWEGDNLAFGLEEAHHPKLRCHYDDAVLHAHRHDSEWLRRLSMTLFLGCSLHLEGREMRNAKCN